MLDDLAKVGLNAGYSGIGRLKGLAEIRGVQTALVKEMAKGEEDTEERIKRSGLGVGSRGQVGCRGSDKNV